MQIADTFFTPVHRLEELCGASQHEFALRVLSEGRMLHWAICFLTCVTQSAESMWKVMQNNLQIWQRRGKKSQETNPQLASMDLQLLEMGLVISIAKVLFCRDSFPPFYRKIWVMFYNVFKMVIQTNIIHMMRNDSAWRVYSTLSSERDSVSFRRWPRNARKRKSCCLLIFNFDWQSESENSLFNQCLHFIIKKMLLFIFFPFTKVCYASSQSKLMCKYYFIYFYTSVNLETWISKKHKTMTICKYTWIDCSTMMFLSNRKSALGDTKIG